MGEVGRSHEETDYLLMRDGSGSSLQSHLLNSELIRCVCSPWREGFSHRNEEGKQDPFCIKDQPTTPKQPTPTAAPTPIAIIDDVESPKDTTECPASAPSCIKARC